MDSPSLKAVLVSLSGLSVVCDGGGEAAFCAESFGRVAQPAAISISHSNTIAREFLFTIDLARKLIRRSRSWRNRHPLFYDLNNVLMCHSQFENHLVVVRRNFSAL